MSTMIIIPVAGTIADDSCRNVNPAIVGPDRTWADFVQNEVKQAKLASKGLAQAVVHMPHGNNKGVINGAYCRDAFAQCQQDYKPLAKGFAKAFSGQNVGMYVGSPYYYTQDLTLMDSYAPYRTASTLIFDHATTFFSPDLLTGISDKRKLLVEGGSYLDIQKWPVEVGWFLESRSPEVMSPLFVGHVSESGRDITVYCAYGTKVERMNTVRYCKSIGCKVAVNLNDLDEFAALGLSIEEISE